MVTGLVACLLISLVSAQVAIRDFGMLHVVTKNVMTTHAIAEIAEVDAPIEETKVTGPAAEKRTFSIDTVIF